MELQQRIQEIFQAEAKAILEIPVNQNFERAIRALRDTQGNLLTTGMGKAGHVARKAAATLCSTGTPAFYIHPGEAAHGDLGLIGPSDAMIAFSTSGKTREVLETLELGRRLGLSLVVGVTSHPDSELRRLSDIVIDMGDVDEPCPMGLAPTASISAMLAISDAIALTLMELKGFTREDFGLRHHAGYLGTQARAQAPS